MFTSHPSRFFARPEQWLSGLAGGTGLLVVASLLLAEAHPAPAPQAWETAAPATATPAPLAAPGRPSALADAYWQPVAVSYRVAAPTLVAPVAPAAEAGSGLRRTWGTIKLMFR